MLALDYIQEGRCLSLELPISMDILAGELRAFGANKTLNQIQRADFLLQPTSELGEHFMKMVRPDDTLQAIAISCRELDVLAGESRQALVDLIMADRFQDLDQMADYLQHGPAALTHLIRLRLGDSQVDLPCDNLKPHLDAAGYDRSARQIRLCEVEYLPLNDRGRELLTKCSPYESIATTNLACALLSTPEIDAPLSVVMDSANRLLEPIRTEPISFICPLKVSVEDDDGQDLVEGDHSLLDYHEDEIRDALKDELPEGKNMADFLRGGLEQKIAAIEWDVTRVRGTLYGSISCELRAPLTDDEQAELIGWITGQNSDGLCEGFEQHPVDTDDGELYVHFWHDGDDYFVMPSEDFFQQLHVQEQGFGGMGGIA